MSTEAIIRAEDRAAGRVIPGPRYWAAFWLVIIAYELGKLSHASGFLRWGSLVGIFLVIVSFGLLLAKYRRRSIH